MYILYVTKINLEIYYKGVGVATSLIVDMTVANVFPPTDLLIEYPALHFSCILVVVTAGSREPRQYHGGVTPPGGGGREEWQGTGYDVRGCQTNLHRPPGRRSAVTLL